MSAKFQKILAEIRWNLISVRWSWLSAMWKSPADKRFSKSPVKIAGWVRTSVLQIKSDIAQIIVKLYSNLSQIYILKLSYCRYDIIS